MDDIQVDDVEIEMKLDYKKMNSYLNDMPLRILTRIFNIEVSNQGIYQLFILMYNMRDRPLTSF